MMHALSYNAMINLPFDDFIREFRKHPYPFLPFDHLINDLKQHGFVISVEHYFRLHAILRHLGPKIDPSRLKSLLCPIFATTPDQQNLFYKIFDRYFLTLSETDAQKISPEASPAVDEPEPAFQPASRKWLYVLAGVLWTILIGLVVYPFLKPPDIKPQPTVIYREIPVVDRKPDIEFVYTLKPAPPPQLTWYQFYGNTLRFTASLMPFILLVLIEIYKHARRRLAVQRGKTRKPPDIWHLQVAAPEPEFLKNRSFYTAANRMRQRLEGDAVRLDIDRTIAATVEHAGFPEFRYRPVTRPPEYLILIDLKTYNDHYAGFVVTLADWLKQEGIFIRRFFYTEDPQVCFSEISGERFYLANLKDKFTDRRLILIGNGDALLDPLTSEPEPWTALFENWTDRVLLTPVPPSEWSLREVMLTRNFIVLPATLAGLEAMVDSLESPVPPSLKPWVLSEPSTAPVPDTLQDVKAIRAYMGNEHAFQWLCACAVYPELNWRLTIYLGLTQGNSITEADLLRLIRLPWLRKGYMPDDLRLKLIAELDTDRLMQIRQQIVNAMKDDPPPPDSTAWDTYQLNLAIHHRMITLDPKERAKQNKELQKHARAIGENRIFRDYTLIRILESEPLSPLILKLPKRFHRMFFQNGLALFGLKTKVRCLIAAMMALFFFFSMPAPEPIKSIEPPPDANITLRFAHIPAGTFMMGSPEDEPGRNNDETLHAVTLTQDFYMQTTEVTQGQWKAVMGDNPSRFKDCGDDCPVEMVSWNDVQSFIEKLNQMEKTKYRLPTEAEWEYAARAGSTTALYTGDIEILGSNNAPALDSIAWYGGNSCVTYAGSYGDCSSWNERQYPCSTGCGTNPVKKKLPNAWGLYDMIGNVLEWCQDWYGEYSKTPVSDPTGPNTGSRRVSRGGSWVGVAAYCRSAYRFAWRVVPSYRSSGLGFRLVLPGQQNQ